MSAHDLVSELAATLKKYNAELTYTKNDDGVHVEIGGETVARLGFDRWIIENVEVAQQEKSITTISGSKYNYTTQVGDALISYGFDTHDELSRFVKAECHCDKPAKKITVQEFKDRLDRETK